MKGSDVMSTLGVFDSGLGGFNVVAHLRAHSDVNIVYLADHKNLPYGLKDEESLKAILIENLQWFKDKGIMHVLIACNTASNYITYLRENFSDMKIDSIIEITASQFEDEDLIIFGTNVTSNVKKYDELLNKKHEYHALSDLASLVEFNDDVETNKYLKEALKKYKGQKHKYLLACTHYSIVEELFEKYLEGEIFDSIGPIPSLYNNLSGERSLEVYTSGNIKILKDQLASMFDYHGQVLPYSKQYKIVLVSDNHGRYEPLLRVVEEHPDASVFIHCGDVELKDHFIEHNFYVVNGNNDYYSPFEDHIILDIEDLRIYITHGHEYPRFSRYHDLHEYAKSINADFVCYGHEHVYKELYIDDMLLINPGSLFYNRDQTSPSYAILTINGKDVSVKRIDYGE